MIKIDEVFEFSNNDTIVIGCSSGPDSMSLVDMLLKVRDKYNLQLVVAHVNHNVRKESYEEAEYLKQYCLDSDGMYNVVTTELNKWVIKKDLI